VVRDLPSWVSDSEHQRVEWLNSLVQKFWPHVSQAIEPIVIAQLQEILSAQVICVRLGLTMKRFSLGSVSPKIVGIRIHSTQNSIARFDIELRWAGDPVITVNVGKFQFAPPVEISELRLSALVRVELLDLVASLPCFKALSVTFMKKPEINFSLKVASLDFMNMGPADFNVTSIVRTALDSVLQNIVVYPKKIIIPMVPANDAGAHNSAGGGGSNSDGARGVVGVLYLNFEKGTRIKKANIFGSNPYILAESRGQVFRSKTQFATRSPEWNETFEILVYDQATQVVSVRVFDADPTGKDMALGRLEFGTKNLLPSRSVRNTVDLAEVSTGAVTFTYEYIPLHGKHDHKWQPGQEGGFGAGDDSGGSGSDAEGDSSLGPGERRRRRRRRRGGRNSRRGGNGEGGGGEGGGEDEEEEEEDAVLYGLSPAELDDDLLGLGEEEFRARVAAGAGAGGSSGGGRRMSLIVGKRRATVKNLEQTAVEEAEAAAAAAAQGDEDDGPENDHFVTATARGFFSKGVSISMSGRRAVAGLSGSYVATSQRVPEPQGGKFTVGILTVSMIHVRNLKFQKMFKKSQPFVALTIANKTQMTQPIADTTFPHYPEVFTFVVKDMATQQLTVHVMNKKYLVGRDKLLGAVDIPLSEVLLSGGTLEQEYMLNGSVHAEFYVGFRLVVTSTSKG
jgi:Ca2+-dependent lipid-binding protein